VNGAWRAFRRRLADGPFGDDGVRRVLVLQGEIAVWTRWENGRRSDARVERLDDERAACACPWPAVGETLVEVVADSPLDDIERVLASAAAPEANRRTPGRLARRALERRLRRRHPDAMVRTAPADAMPLLATLLHVELPDDWRRRLDVLQRDAVTIVALRSAIRLHESAPGERDGDVLRITRGGGVERHMLLRSGCPTFTRVASVNAGRGTTFGPSAALDETLAHLAATHGVNEPRLHRFPGVSGAGVAAAPLALSGAVSEGPATDDVGGDDVTDAHRLAALALGTRDRVRGAATAGLLDKHRHRVELRRLHAATALTTAIAGLTVLASAVHGIDSARRRARAVAAGEALSLHVERLAESVADRHPTPALADASLALLERRERANAPEADEVLAMLAGFLTIHPGIRLDRLDWSTPEPGTADDGRPGNASGQPLRRMRRDDDSGEPVPAWLEIAGRVDAAGALSVRERQRRFEAFVAALGRDDRVTALDVQLSPASAAAADGDGAEARPRTDYVLQLRYVTRS